MSFLSQASITVLFTAGFHLFFYFPAATTRLIALYSNAINVPPDVSSMLLATNFTSYGMNSIVRV